MERLYGDDKKKVLTEFYDHFCNEIEQLFFNKFQELSDLNVGEGETTPQCVGECVDKSILNAL